MTIGNPFEFLCFTGGVSQFRIGHWFHMKVTVDELQPPPHGGFQVHAFLTYLTFSESFGGIKIKRSDGYIMKQ